MLGMGTSNIYPAELELVPASVPCAERNDYAEKSNTIAKCLCTNSPGNKTNKIVNQIYSTWKSDEIGISISYVCIYAQHLNSIVAV